MENKNIIWNNMEYRKELKNKELETRIKHFNKYMSNSKWYKLFETFENNDTLHIKIKFLMDYEKEIILGNDIFIFNVGIECFYGSFLYKEIEQVKIFEKPENKAIRNTVDEIEKIITSIGRFEYKKEIGGIIIYGYK
jgi:hypothetical protein